MKIALIIANGYGMGGTIRTVFNIAGGLSTRHEVEIVSLVQHRTTPFFDLPEGVPIRALAPTPGWTDRPRQGLIDRWRESRPCPTVAKTEAEKNGAFNARTSHELRKFLRTTDADVVVGTRPGVNMLLARWAPPRLVTIGQEHVHLDNHKEDVRRAIQRLYPRLDGLTVLTEADKRAYEDFLPVSPGWLTTMPNALPPGEYPRSTLDNPIIAAAGRLTPIKQYPKLIDAFAIVAREHPEWRLRIYGGGGKESALKSKIAKMGLHNQVMIMGRTKDLTGELAKASILAVSSKAEGFGMTIIEGFAVGVPAVSFDCPHGPREIITHERDGLLVPHQDVDALAQSLLRLVRDREERKRMGEEALKSAARYDLSLVTERWESFLDERIAAKRARTAA
ncbi:glycosyltransferase family 4 protein [Marinactinospora thermotolerans]|uniref:Glycosyltransferase involved in cell wall bisynthesis n=1 Tax=Marinactinospora thermotolerans DSM 45154 TaxID=1122192 RepID=A0A1T4QLV1_9ACTN|nr:glycosyltransferase family 4 protein [Marinactinospora thermotolerans]SKA04617.1 Glycosyltransferase involved in cell wall bisynthesis [Marinactinospora thermotolerans DSM 45154]